MFSDCGMFRYRVWTSGNPWKCFGLAEDEDRNLWFIEFDRRLKETFLKCCDPEKEGFAISLKRLVGDRRGESRCRFLTFSKGKLYITDLGLNKVYVLDPKKFESVRGFGSFGAGDGQLHDPAGLAVDDVGNILVADSKNHRLCLFDKKGKWIGNHQVIMCFFFLNLF